MYIFIYLFIVYIYIYIFIVYIYIVYIYIYCIKYYIYMYQNLELIDISGPRWRCLALHDCLADGGTKNGGRMWQVVPKLHQLAQVYLFFWL